MEYRIQLIKDSALGEVLHFEEAELICKYFNVGDVILDEERYQNGKGAALKIVAKDYTVQWSTLRKTCWMLVEENTKSTHLDLQAQILAQKA